MNNLIEIHTLNIQKVIDESVNFKYLSKMFPFENRVLSSLLEYATLLNGCHYYTCHCISNVDHFLRKTFRFINFNTRKNLE